ncbi:MAG TPA: hypothetical protein VL547_14035 [Dinghuibacter sp.]|uniref:hypothetical protein n=1 Tax=Dinghuibacter sp. TaxID=2024697 RepID=UPI002BF01250|nr:hypothetical protein [Dinghuibacter sp.]HTJ13149.1 hypothetical protein [Dinghuibacter sp.]
MRIDPVRVLLILVIALAACRQARQPAANTQKALGTYDGNFGKGILALTINYVNGDVVSGYDIRQGNRRNLNGKVKSDGAYLSLALREPGDRAEDGVFTLKLDTASGRVKGNWSPLQSGKATARDFQLKLDTDYQHGLYEIGLGEWLVGDDSTLDLQANGYCEYNYYDHAKDSTSQLNTVHGSYVRTGNTVRIDWERGAAVPVRQMTLRLIRRPVEDSPEDSTETLEGSGWKLVRPID